MRNQTSHTAVRFIEKRGLKNLLLMRLGMIVQVYKHSRQLNYINGVPVLAIRLA